MTYPEHALLHFAQVQFESLNSPNIECPSVSPYLTLDFVEFEILSTRIESNDCSIKFLGFFYGLNFPQPAPITLLLVHIFIGCHCRRRQLVEIFKDPVLEDRIQHHGERRDKHINYALVGGQSKMLKGAFHNNFPAVG
jgi:hypothetical protein